MLGVNDVTQDDKKRNRVDVNIYNRTYRVIGREPDHHVQLVASLVDQKMKEIHQTNQQLDTTMLAVLTAVNTMNDYLKLKEDYDRLVESHKEEEE